ncbi:MAG: hypothetical protein BAJALOKI3v1_30055 [Promethearchaeota archaeon]|nr:MAG: hypothetical protein BAJALOKI3v1_30055 [Candidatus Lokiarchaeota archaeon]
MFVRVSFLDQLAQFVTFLKSDVNKGILFTYNIIKSENVRFIGIVMLNFEHLTLEECKLNDWDEFIP